MRAEKQDAQRTKTGLASHEEYALVTTAVTTGKGFRGRIDKMYLDLTDGENLAFRYVV